MKYSGANTAHQAREILSATLNTLQSEPNIPDEVLAVAAQVAQSVGALFQAQGAEDEVAGKEQILRALDFLRQTLALLQQFEAGNAGIDRATASIAQAMGLLYPLSVKEAGPVRGEPTVKLATDDGAADAAAERAREEAEAQKAREESAAADRAREEAEAQKAREESAAADRARDEAEARRAREESAAADRARDEAEAQRAREEAEAAEKKAREEAEARRAREAAAAAARLERPAETGRLEEREANIGVNTETNLYTGFTGEVRDGGVFLATYNTLPRGSWVDLFVTLPGNYNFTCRAWVRFVRDPLDLTGDANPGMGLQFDGLSPEAEELAKRFAKKRAPFFFDE